jgi:hypothetical protein
VTICHGLVWSIDAIAQINWLEVIKAVASVVTAYVAFQALKNWKRQDKAKREAEFLDALIEATHAYVIEMSLPVELVRSVEIGMESHMPSRASKDRKIKGAIAYIQKDGERVAKRLLEVLGAVKPSVIQLRSLAAKGQIFRFNGYVNCYNAVAILTWQFDRIEALLSVIGSPTYNWEHPRVLKLLKNVMAIKPDDIRKAIEESNTAILEFARETYQCLYK